jgi:spore coat polysaccharide biosynthesis protein SpsF
MLLPLKTNRLLEEVLLRARHFFPQATIVLATTTLPEDAELCELAESSGVKTFRGSVEDVLERHLHACLEYKIENYLSLDGDDPFFDERAAMACVEMSRSFAYVHSEGLPIGMNTTGVNVRQLRKAVEGKKPGNSEGWGRFFANPSFEFANAMIKITPTYDLYGYARLTMDYEEDIQFARAVATHFGGTASNISGVEILRALEASAELRNINLGRNAEYQKRFETLYGATPSA